MSNYAKPRFSTIGSQEKLEALGFMELELDGPTPAVDALRLVQSPDAPRITIMHSYFREHDNMAASIILQDHSVSIVSLDMSQNKGPYLINEHSFLQTFQGGEELKRHLASDSAATVKTQTPAPLGSWVKPINLGLSTHSR